ncbi:MAG: hypothetical protein WHF31_15160 [Candidatus Dehalobacter alkaniphilus]
MDQTQFNGQFVAALAIIVPLLIGLGTILVKLNTTINLLTFTVKSIDKKMNDVEKRLDEHDQEIHDIQLNCAGRGHTKVKAM